MTRRAGLEEREVPRLADLAHDAGTSMRVAVDLHGEVTFFVGALGSFTDLTSLEAALRDAMRVTA